MKKIIFRIVFFNLCVISSFLIYSSASAASLSLSPSQGNYYVGENFTIRVLLDSPNEAANALSGLVSFPTNKLQVVSLTKGSVIDFWVEQPTFSNSQGSIRFEGVTFNPGFSSYAGQVLNITFRGKEVGEASLDFDSASILANDGEGTDITRLKQGARLTLLPSRPKVDQSVSLVTISSPTHPESGRWYSSNEPQFNITFSTSTQSLSFVIDNLATTTPGTTGQPVFATYTSPALKDGVWYFHIRGRERGVWGEASHFPFLIDTKPPEPFTIKLANTSGISSPYATQIVFGTTDSLSQVERYEVFLGDKEIATIKASSSASYHLVDLPYQAWGTRKVKVVAFDNAGNSTESKAEFIISSSIWLFVIIAIVLLFVALLIWFIIFTAQTKRKVGKDIDIKIKDLLPEKVDLELFKQSETVSQDLEQLYIDLRNLLALKSQHKAFFYLKEARARNLTNEQIGAELRAAGWSDEEIISLIWEERSIQAISEKIKKNLEDLKS